MCLKEAWELDNLRTVGRLTIRSWLFSVKVSGKKCKSNNRSPGRQSSPGLFISLQLVACFHVKNDQIKGLCSSEVAYLLTVQKALTSTALNDQLDSSIWCACVTIL